MINSNIFQDRYQAVFLFCRFKDHGKKERKDPMEKPIH
jgi:hypothetical protein